MSLQCHYRVINNTSLFYHGSILPSDIYVKHRGPIRLRGEVQIKLTDRPHRIPGNLSRRLRHLHGEQKRGQMEGTPSSDEELLLQLKVHVVLIICARL